MKCIACHKEFAPDAHAKLGQDHDDTHTELRTKCPHCKEGYYAYVPNQRTRVLALTLARHVKNWASLYHAKQLYRKMQKETA